MTYYQFIANQQSQRVRLNRMRAMNEVFYEQTLESGRIDLKF